MGVHVSVLYQNTVRIASLVAHEILLLIASLISERSDEPNHTRILTRAFAVSTPLKVEA